MIIHSGERLSVDRDRMQAVNDWVADEVDNIVQDPSFWVLSEPVPDEVYPWEGTRVHEGDSVTVPAPRGAADALRVFQIYGHLHLMVKMGRQEEWLPEAPDATGFELERAILERTADAWILGRTVFGMMPYGPLDELAYAKEAGFLDALIFTARPDEFGASRVAWARENPDGMEAYRDWFLNTFNREPPGLRAS